MRRESVERAKPMEVREMQGTKWVAPRMGATYRELREAGCYIPDAMVRYYGEDHHTNLELTGFPLNAYDDRRAENAE